MRFSSFRLIFQPTSVGDLQAMRRTEAKHGRETHSYHEWHRVFTACKDPVVRIPRESVQPSNPPSGRPTAPPSGRPLASSSRRPASQ